MGNNTFFKAVEDHAPLLLTIYGAVSITAVGVATAFATLRTKSKVEEMRKDVEGLTDEEAKLIRKKAYIDIGLTWLLPVSVAATGTLAVVGAYKSSTETKLLATAGAGAIGKKVYDDRKEKKDNPKIEDKSVPNTNYDNVDLVMDGFTGEIFRMDRKTIENAINVLNIENQNMEVRLDRFYKLIGKSNEGYISDMMYWDPLYKSEYNYGVKHIGIELEPSACIDERGDHVPCWEIVYSNYEMQTL